MIPMEGHMWVMNNDPVHKYRVSIPYDRGINTP